MSLSASRSKPRFLLDENVSTSVSDFLKSMGFPVQHVPKGSSDLRVAGISKSKKLVLITNDSDFADAESFLPSKAFAVVLIQIHQHKIRELEEAISGLLRASNFQRTLKGK